MRRGMQLLWNRNPPFRLRCRLADVLGGFMRHRRDWDCQNRAPRITQQLTGLAEEPAADTTAVRGADGDQLRLRIPRRSKNLSYGASHGHACNGGTPVRSWNQSP